MTSNPWASIAREIAAERNTTKPAPETSTLDKLKVRVVAAELAQLGVTDPAKVQAVAARMTVNDAGDVVGLDRHGVPAVGTGNGYFMTVSDVLADLGETTPGATASAPAAPPVTGNPFLKGSSAYNVTAGMLLFKTNPTLAADLAAQAGLDLRGNR